MRTAGRSPHWWRTWRAAIAVALLTAIAVALLYVSNRAPRASAAVALGPGGRPAIAVMSFENVAGSPETSWLSTGVPSMLLTGLAQTRGLDIISAQRVHEALEQSGHPDRPFVGENVSDTFVAVLRDEPA